MALSTRKAEVEALVELLESGEHETAEELAKAVFRKVAGRAAPMNALQDDCA